MTQTHRDENQEVSLPGNGLSALPEGVFVDGFSGSKTKIQNPVFEKSYVNIGDVWHIHGASDTNNIKEDIVLRQNVEGKFVINSDLPTNQKSIVSFKYTVVKYTLVVIFGVLIIAGITLAVFALLMPSTKQNDSDYKYDESVLDNSTLRIVTRREWSALQSKSTPRNLAVNPPKMVIIAHTAGTHCNVTDHCSELVRNIQAYHLSIYDDIGYNFLIGGDGLAYAGLGWGVEGAHTKYYNNRSIGISFMGNFMNVVPPKRQLHAGLALIEYGVKHGKIDPDYVLYGHKQLIITQSPGDELMLEIEKWPHWEPRN